MKFQDIISDFSIGKLFSIVIRKSGKVPVFFDAAFYIIDKPFRYHDWLF
jgi:hypothetical protein